MKHLFIRIPVRLPSSPGDEDSGGDWFAFPGAAAVACGVRRDCVYGVFGREVALFFGEVKHVRGRNGDGCDSLDAVELNTGVEINVGVDREYITLLILFEIEYYRLSMSNVVVVGKQRLSM